MKKKRFTWELQSTYGACEASLKSSGFKVLHFIRDERGDWGDDGGYIVAISQKADKSYLHILEVNHNINVSEHILDEQASKKYVDDAFNKDRFDDFVVLPMQKIQAYLYRLTSYLNYLSAIKIDDEDIVGWDANEVLEEDPLLKDLLKDFDFSLKTLLFMLPAYIEDKATNMMNLFNLQNNIYVPNYIYLDDEDNEDDFIIAE